MRSSSKRVVGAGGAGTAARAVGAILAFAVSEGIIEHNLSRGVPRQADKKRTRRLTPAEYQALGVAFREIEPWQVILGTRLLLLTDCRLGEIVNLKWMEIDEASGCCRLTKTKEGQSIRPIGRCVFELLATVDSCRPFVAGGALSAASRIWPKKFLTSSCYDGGLLDLPLGNPRPRGRPLGAPVRFNYTEGIFKPPEAPFLV
jgi:integrase